MLGKRKRDAGPLAKSFRHVKPVDAVTFDFSARQDYLSGFHKRKLQRAKYAQEEAAKREREERIQHRKEIRAERKKELEEHVKAVNMAVRRAEHSDVSGESGIGAGSEDGEWPGIVDGVEPRAVNHEEEYSGSDDDQEATVTIEAVDIDKEGLHRVEADDEDDASDSGGLHNSAPVTTGDTKNPKKTGWTNEKPKVPKKPRKRFRYESKAGRKEGRMRQKASKTRKREKRNKSKG